MKRLFGNLNEAESNKAEPNKKKEERPPLISPEEAEKINRDMEMINRARELEAKNHIITKRVPNWAFTDTTAPNLSPPVRIKYVFSDPEDEKKFNSMNNNIEKGYFFAELAQAGRAKRVRVPIESDD